MTWKPLCSQVRNQKYGLIKWNKGDDVILEAMWVMTSFSRILSEDVILEAIELMTSSSRPWGNDVILEAMG